MLLKCGIIWVEYDSDLKRYWHWNTLDKEQNVEILWREEKKKGRVCCKRKGIYNSEVGFLLEAVVNCK